MTVHKNSIDAGRQNLQNYVLTHRSELAERGRKNLAAWRRDNPTQSARHSRAALTKARAKRWTPQNKNKYDFSATRAGFAAWRAKQLRKNLIKAIATKHQQK